MSRRGWVAAGIATAAVATLLPSALKQAKALRAVYRR